VVGPDAGPRHDRQRVVLLEEQLAGRVEPERPGALLVEQLARTADDPIHRLVPARLAQLAAVAHQRSGQPIGRLHRLPRIEILGSEPATIDPVALAATNPDQAPVLHRELVGVAVGVQDARCLDPAVGLLGEVLVDTCRPRLRSPVRRAFAPWFGDAIDHAGSSTRRLWLADGAGRHLYDM
jgi:hypothetical protein